MNMRRYVYLLLTTLFFVFFLFGCNSVKNEITTIKIGVCLYLKEDTFIDSIKSELEGIAKEYEQKNGVKVVMTFMDAKKNQNIQDTQVERLIAQKYDVICVNIVDRSSASNIISNAMNAGIPIIFFNRQPVDDDMKRWDKLFYVGVDPKESAVLQGNIVIDEYNNKGIDRNKDGSIAYVLLEGESSHQDSLIRTKWSIQTLKNSGIKLKKLAGGIGNWDRSQAYALMKDWIKKYYSKIELVISNNDDMALGAIDAIEEEGMLGKIDVVGIDGTKKAVEAIKKGKLLGSVKSDINEYANTIFDIAVSLINNKNNKQIVGRDKYHNCRQFIYTK